MLKNCIEFDKIKLVKKIFLYLWIFLIPISKGGMNMLGLVLLVLNILTLINFKKLDLKLEKIDYLIVGYQLLILASVFWAYNYEDVLHDFFKIIVFYVVMYYTVKYSVKTIQELKLLLKIYFISTFISITYALFQKFFVGISRVEGFTGNANRLGAQMMIFLTINIIFFIFYEKNKKFRWYYAIGIIAGFLGLYTTLSRSSILSVFFAVFCILAIYKKRFLLLFVGLSIAILFILPSEYTNRLKKLGDLRSHNVYQRIQMNKAGIKVFKDNPIFGIGFNNVRNMYEYYNFPEIDQSYKHLHNLFINTGVELGVIGLALLISTLFIIMKKAYEILKIRFNLLTLSILGIVVAEIFYNTFDMNSHAKEVGLIVIFFIGILSAQHKNMIEGNGELSQFQFQEENK